MKTLITALAFLTITSSAFAESRSADRLSLFMVGNIAKKCPVQFAEALKNENILSLDVDESKNDQGQSVSTSKLSTGYLPSPVGGQEIVVVSTVTLVEVAHKVQSADGWLTDDTCGIEKVK